MKNKHLLNCLGLSLFFLAFFGLFTSSALASGQGEILVKMKGVDEPFVKPIGNDENLESVMDYWQDQPEVEYVEPNFSYHASVLPSDDEYDKQWYLEKIRAPYAWDKVRETPDIIVAVIDSGIQIRHPDLYPNIWVNEDEFPGNGKDDDGNGFIDDYNGWDFLGNTPDPSPKFEEGFNESGVVHGTLVAGIIGAVGNNGSGVAGVSWNVKIMPLRVLDDKGEGRTNEVVRAIDYAIANGADVINFSFVGFDYSRSLYEAIKRAHAAGILMVAAAGNESNQGNGYDLNDTPMYPACSEGDENMVIGVSATDAVDQKAYFSSYGYRCVDISAPGISFYGLSVYKPTEKIGSRPFDKYFSGYWSGTSMASPVVAGVIALVNGYNPGLKSSEVRDIVLASADNIDKLNPSYLGQIGSGRVNAFSAVNLAERTLKDRQKKIVTAAYSSGAPEVKIFDQFGQAAKTFSLGNSDKDRSGYFIAGGDLDGDRRDEVVVANGASSKPEVSVYDQEGKLRNSFLAYAPQFMGGVKVAIGDIDGDGQNEIITGAGPGGGPHIRVFDRNGKVKRQFFALDKSFRGGVSVAAGDVDGDGKDEIVVGVASKGAPLVKVFDGNGSLRSQFYAYDRNFMGGVNLSVANVINEAGRSRAEIITSASKGGGPHIRVFDQSGNVRSQFFAYDKGFRGGVLVAAGDVDGDGLSDIITGAGPTGGPHIRAFKPDGRIISSFYAFDSSFSGGVSVGVASVSN